MAGSWPDVPSRKMAYHDDGTVVAARYPADGAPYENFYEWDGGVNGLDQLNDLDFTIIGDDWANKRFGVAGIQDGGLIANTENVWIFPELRDFYGYVIVATQENAATGGYGTFDTYYSADTTNGIDGTWTLILNHTGSNTPQGAHPEDWRTAIVEETHLAIRAFKVIGDFGVFTAGDLVFRAAYLFGTITSGETPDRILFINDATGLEFTKPMDWGDVPRGSVIDWDIYLKNNSATLTYNTGTLDFVTLHDDSDTWYTIKATGGSFLTTHSVSSVAAAGRYPTGTDVLTVRLTVPTDEPLSIVEAILELSPAASWT